jgi:hypothetical protein
MNSPIARSQEETKKNYEGRVEKQSLEKSASHNYYQSANENYEPSTTRNWQSEKEIDKIISKELSELEIKTINDSEADMSTKESSASPTNFDKKRALVDTPYHAHDRGFSKQTFNNLRASKQANQVSYKTTEESLCWTDMDMIDRIYPHPAHKFEGKEYRETRRDRTKSDGSELVKTRNKIINQFFDVDSQFCLGLPLTSDSTEPNRPPVTRVLSEDTSREGTPGFKYIKKKNSFI